MEERDRLIGGRTQSADGVERARSVLGGEVGPKRVKFLWLQPAVAVGRPTPIAGHTGQKDQAGNSLAGDFEKQMRQTFKNIEATLKEAGASLKDIVTMTVFLADSRYTTRMTEIRTEIFGEDFPASAAITVTGFADPSMLIEIQGIAVIG